MKHLIAMMVISLGSGCTEPSDLRDSQIDRRIDSRTQLQDFTIQTETPATRSSQVEFTALYPADHPAVFEFILAKDKECRSSIQKIESPLTVQYLTLGPDEGSYFVCVFAISTAGIRRAANNNGFLVRFDKTAPVIDIGENKTAGSDFAVDGISQESNVKFLWSMVSGPGVMVFSNANEKKTSISASADGKYVVRLSATDEAGNVGTDEIEVDWIATAPIAELANIPNLFDAQTALNISVGGKGTKQYVYKIAPDGQVNCLEQVGYSEPKDAALAITDSLNSYSDGALKICVLSINLAGITQPLASPTEFIWTKDTSAPLVDAGVDQLAGSELTINGSIQEENVAAIVWEKLSGPGIITFGSPASASSTITASVDGNYVLRLKVTDKAGNEHSDNLSLTWLAFQPTVIISGAPTGASNDTDITVAVSGLGVHSYKYKVGNIGSTVCSNASGYSAAIPAATNITANISGLADGQIVICALGLNLAGISQSLVSPTSTGWQKDTSAPASVFVTSPSAFSNSTSVTVAWSGGADTNFKHFELKACTQNDCSTGCIDGGTAAASPGTIANLVHGQSYHLCVRSEDTLAQKSAFAVSSSQIEIDTQNPSVDAGSDLSVDTATLVTATVTDDNPLTSQWSKISGPGSVIFSAPTAASTNISADQDGSYVLRLTATDAAGNVSFDEINFQWNVNLASAPEVVSKASRTLGWGGVGNNELIFDLTPYQLPAGLTGTPVYKCRYGRVYSNSGAVSWNTNNAFSNCDQTVDGTTAEAKLTSPGGDAAIGTFRLQVKVTVGAKESPIATTEFYMHDSLNGLSFCPHDITLDALFAEAAASPYLASIQSFGNDTMLSAPFLKVRFADDSYSDYMTLRHQFSRRTVGGIDLIVMRRNYTSSLSSSGCKTKLTTSPVFPSGGAPVSSQIALEDIDGNTIKSTLSCTAIAFNADGRGLCLSPTDTVPYTEVKFVKNIKSKFSAVRNSGGIHHSKAPIFSPKFINFGGENVGNYSSENFEALELKP